MSINTQAASVVLGCVSSASGSSSYTVSCLSCECVSPFLACGFGTHPDRIHIMITFIHTILTLRAVIIPGDGAAEHPLSGGSEADRMHEKLA